MAFAGLFKPSENVLEKSCCCPSKTPFLTPLFTLSEGPETASQKGFEKTFLDDLKKSLRQSGAKDILISTNGRYMINIDEVDCDMYRFLKGDLQVLDDITQGDDPEKVKNRQDLIPVICKFMEEKPRYRSPNFENLKILDKYLTPEFVKQMKENPDEKINPNLKLDYISPIVSVMSKAQTKVKKPKKQAAADTTKKGANASGIKDLKADNAEPEKREREAEEYNDALEKNIAKTGGDLLSQLGNLYGNSQPTQPQPQAASGLNDMFGFGVQPTQQPSDSMKEVYKNNEISIYSQFTGGNNSYQGNFFISNNTGKNLNNVKLNFLVKKHIQFKVISTSGNVLEPNASLGIKKEVSLQNNDPSKPIVIKMNLSYNVDGRDVSESAMINGI